MWRSYKEVREKKKTIEIQLPKGVYVKVTPAVIKNCSLMLYRMNKTSKSFDVYIELNQKIFPIVKSLLRVGLFFFSHHCACLSQYLCMFSANFKNDIRSYCNSKQVNFLTLIADCYHLSWGYIGCYILNQNCIWIWPRNTNKTSSSSYEH